MAHVYRFFVPGGMAAGSAVELAGEELHHALRVARVKVGEAVSLFDGSGSEFFGTVARAERRSVSVEILRVSEAEDSPTRLTVISAALHSEKNTATLPPNIVVRRGLCTVHLLMEIAPAVFLVRSLVV